MAVDVPDISALARVALVVAGLLSALAVRTLDGGRRRERFAAVRSRLLLGVPWGTLVVVCFVLAFYLFVQHGADHWYDPLMLPFVSWSYLYPLGVVTAPFAHSGASHLMGNLLATAVLAPVAEYAWSHFPTRRGSSSFASPLTNPYVRAFLVFPVAVLGVALLTSVFAWGPLIGFSGAVFVFAGFAVVRYPILAALAVLTRGLVSALYYAALDPTVTARVTPTLSRPSWANIAIQGHVLGFLLGAALGVALVARRGERPSAFRLWLGTALLGTSTALWAVWWYGPGDSFVLYRGLGLALLLVVATLVATAVRASTRESSVGVSRRTLAVFALLLPLLVMAVVAVPVNLTTVGGDVSHGPDATVLHVRGYDVTYATDAVNPKTTLVNVSAANASSRVEQSGVIVENERRQLWNRVISPTELAFDGTRSFQVGGVDWSRTVTARRQGWSVAGNGSVYQVWLRVEGREFRHAYASPPRTADPVVAGRNVTVTAADGVFYLDVSRANRSLGAVPVPAANATASAGGLRFVRPPNSSRVLAVANGTRVTVATAETYE